MKRLRGLRAQLVLVFLLVSVLSALTGAMFTFRQGRDAIVDGVQADALRGLRGHLAFRAPDLPADPARADLRTLAVQLDLAGSGRGWRTALSYRGGSLVTAGPQAPPLPASLRARADTATTALAQRFHRDGTPWLAVALPVTATNADSPAGTDSDDGDTARQNDPPPLVVYASFSLASQQRDVEALATAVRAGALPVALVSVVAALLAAGRLLRPVRRLRAAAEQVAGGALDTRVTVSGDDELADLGRTFNVMSATLQADAAALRDMEARARRFAADVSHELRTPLAAMAAVTGVLDADAGSGRLDPLTAEALRLVADETRSLTRLVEDLIEVSRFDAGAAVLNLDEVDLRELVVKTLAVRHWQDRVRAEVPAGLRARLDPRRVDVILANLVGNALRHGGTQANAPRHGGAQASVLVRVTADADRVAVIVSDDGPGIPAALLPHVFDRFTKGDAARTRSEGSGLGLAIAAENARLHGGTLTAANAPGGGAVLTLVLPRNPLS
ncbi:ATP-binding protein [Nonomuraea fuscirosea]|uniref:ATP-binding protein n=1 Tax=Nonomuraea fuscirosea TaxID=1291556 RepID=UPI0037A19FFE